jgi:hypothetical protein
MKKQIIGLMLAFTMTTCFGASAAEPTVKVDRDDEAGKLTVAIDGKEALVYLYGADQDMPHYYPVRSPSGKLLTIQRTEPYPHHRSVWFGDKVQLDGKRPVSFYAPWYTRAKEEDAPAAFRDQVRHAEFLADGKGEAEPVIRSKSVWMMDFDVPVADEIRELRVAALGDAEYLMDLKFELVAAYGDLTFVSDWVHYAWPYVRMHPQFNVKDGGGTIRNSEGGTNQKETNGKPARWVDYYNTIDGQTEGLAFFSHPDNPYPHKWLTRDYGTFGPRRVDARSGEKFTLEKGESIKQHVGILVHRGDTETAEIAKRYEQYVKGEL